MNGSAGRTSSDAGRSYAGPEILRVGFRPFFLAAGIYRTGLTTLAFLPVLGYAAWLNRRRPRTASALR